MYRFVIPPDRHRPKRRLQRSCFWSRFSSSAKRRPIGGNRLQGVPPLHSEWTSTASPSPQRRIRFMEVPFSNANRIRLIEVPTLSRWPSSPSGWDSPQGVPPPPSLQRMGFASRWSPSLSQSEWDSHQEGHPLQSEWDSLLTTGLVAARAPFKGFSFAKATLIKGFPLSKGLHPLT